MNEPADSNRGPNRTERRQAVAAGIPIQTPLLSYLQVLDGPSAGELVVFPDQGEIVLGRSPDCQLRLEDPAVSWEHARITLRPTARVCDLGSTNGTSLRGQVCEPELPLCSGDILWVANAIHVRYGVQSEREIELAQKLYQGATRDFLTGLLNRATFFRHLEQEFALWERHGGEFGLLVLDADYFKQVNDSHGHGAGDQLLKELANTLREQCRLEDVVARYGGEEFVVLMPDVDEIEMRSKANSIRAAIASSPLLTNGGPIPRTISVGGAHAAPGDSIAAMDLLQQADEAMYRAKHQGRNRVVVH